MKASKPSVSPAILCGLFALLVGCEDNGREPFFDYPVENTSLVGVWTGQGGGLTVELDLGKASCTFGCGGDGGYEYTYAPGSFGGQGDDAHYSWIYTGTAPPAPKDSIDIYVGDAVSQRAFYFVLSRKNSKTLEGRVFGGLGMQGLSSPITLRK